VSQGVLLLNQALTYSPEDGTAGHLPIWSSWTDEVIVALDSRREPPVFLLMGEKAQRAGRRLIKRSFVVQTPHPAARTTHLRAFLESGALREVNSVVYPAVDWSL
jgi:uracil DNA glycosylase